MQQHAQVQHYELVYLIVMNRMKLFWQYSLHN
jgi:hypothetical protein